MSAIDGQRELAPCPFCGDEASVAYYDEGGWCVSCDNMDGCAMLDNTFPTEAEAIVAWNRRAPTQEEPVVPDGMVLVSRATLTAILVGDWAALIQTAVASNCLPVNCGSDDPSEYEWAGEHETDARHTYPNRARLLDAILAAILGTDGGET